MAQWGGSAGWRRRSALPRWWRCWPAAAARQAEVDVLGVEDRAASSRWPLRRLSDGTLGIAVFGTVSRLLQGTSLRRFPGGVTAGQIPDEPRPDPANER